MKKAEVEEVIAKIVEEIIDGTELELIDVEYVRERDWYLRIYIDKVGGIEIDDCQLVSGKLAEYLDNKDPIKEKYYLEVSSPGIDRPLKKDKDFIKNYGKKVDIAFFVKQNGNKKIQAAILKNHDDNKITVIVNDKEVLFERKEIANIRPHIEF